MYEQLDAKQAMTNSNENKKLDDSIEAFLSGELDSLEGEQDAADLWKRLQQDPSARARYDALVFAMREIAGRGNKVKSFGDDEADALWPLLMARVAEDARHRTGLSKDALRHMAVPDLVASISRAIVSLSQKETPEEVVVEAASEAPENAVLFSIASVGGSVSLRLYKNDSDATGFVANIADNDVTTNVETSELDAWAAVSSALQTLSMATAELLGDETLVKGRIEVKQGRAEVRLAPVQLNGQTGNK